jgi:hypothetical protein
VSQNYEIIELASEGYFYPSGHPLSSGKIKIYPITAKQEELLANTNFAKYGIQEKEFLDEVVVGEIDHKNLLYCDKESILLNLRIANYGAVSRIKTRCESCEHEFEEDISFGFLSKPFNFSMYEKGKNELKYKFPVCKKEVFFKLPTCEEQRIYDEHGWLTFIKCMTTRIEGVKDEKMDTFYDYDLGVADNREFKKFYNKNTPGYINEITTICPSCNSVKKSKVNVDLDIFGIQPQSVNNIHSEIFDLCYYSNGAFTQEGVYKMSTRLRTFYIKKLVDAKKAEVEAQKNASKGGGSNKISRPSISKKG